MRAKIIVAILIGLASVGLPLLGWMGYYIIKRDEGGNGAQPPLLIVTLVCLGAIGGMLSSLMRIYKEEGVEKVASLGNDQTIGLFAFIVFAFVPAMSGAVSSLIVFLVFMSGFVKGVIFPDFHCRLPQGCIDFGSLINDFGPLKAEDYAKTLLWGFLSGFSERLMPSFVESLSLPSGQGNARPGADKPEPVDIRPLGAQGEIRSVHPSVARHSPSGV